MHDIHPSRRILLLATTGGFTHAIPVLELGVVLASRGHDIRFATNTGQACWADAYPFISLIHDVGPPVPDDATEAHYERMRVWRPEHGMGPMMQLRRLYDAAWTETYRRLREICDDPTTRPDFIVADFFAEAAARDMLHDFNIQIAVVWPQMPYFMAQASYVPGQPGFQVDVTLTSENASLLSRIRNELVVLRGVPGLVSWALWTRRLRADSGVYHFQEPQASPNYLVLVNSFFGLEVPKQLPPLLAAVGPILSDVYPPLDDTLADFLSKHDRTMYISFGTHVALPSENLDKIMRAIIHCLDDHSINGVIWSVAAKPRAKFDETLSYVRRSGPPTLMSSILANEDAQLTMPLFAPQRAILAHPNTKVFLTHGGGSSANETTFHGVPVIAIGYFFDQLCNSVRLQEAGVGVSLDKSTFTSADISDAVHRIVLDADGCIRRNVTRMQRIAHAASHRKHHAADLIEEVMYDQELRLRDGAELRPMHLQTADARMPYWKVQNLDLWFIGFSGVAILGFTTWWTIRRGFKSLPQTWTLMRSFRIGVVGYLLPRSTLGPSFTSR
ncbi:hypothetical protein S40293_08241 [Stachybotrys chartarum IBT 40293]|nr:hypothetical protein S40293_08241 [Stachybotrys chartarum IBT 40293]